MSQPDYREDLDRMAGEGGTNHLSPVMKASNRRHIADNQSFSPQSPQMVKGKRRSIDFADADHMNQLDIEEDRGNVFEHSSWFELQNKPMTEELKKATEQSSVPQEKETEDEDAGDWEQPPAEWLKDMSRDGQPAPTLNAGEKQFEKQMSQEFHQDLHGKKQSSADKPRQSLNEPNTMTEASLNVGQVRDVDMMYAAASLPFNRNDPEKHSGFILTIRPHQQIDTDRSKDADAPAMQRMKRERENSGQMSNTNANETSHPFTAADMAAASLSALRDPPQPQGQERESVPKMTTAHQFSVQSGQIGGPERFPKQQGIPKEEDLIEHEHAQDPKKTMSPAATLRTMMTKLTHLKEPEHKQQTDADYKQFSTTN